MAQSVVEGQPIFYTFAHHGCVLHRPFTPNFLIIFRLGYSGSKIPLILQDLRRILKRTSCKSLQETYKIASKTAYKISCQDSCQGSSKILQDLTRLTNSLVPGNDEFQNRTNIFTGVNMKLQYCFYCFWSEILEVN